VISLLSTSSAHGTRDLQDEEDEEEEEGGGVVAASVTS
jgi:hypothetical protein